MGRRDTESRKIKYLIPRYTRGRVLEVGCGQQKSFPHFIGVDNAAWSNPDVYADPDKLDLFADNSVDALFSSYVLDRVADMQATLNEWGRVIKPGGFLCLYVPSAHKYPLVGAEGADSQHQHDIYPEDLERLLSESNTGWIIELAEQRYEDDEQSLFLVARKGMGQRVDPPLGKTACVCRFGGFGDMIQTALVFPRLKELGYHVTVMTTPSLPSVVLWTSSPISTSLNGAAESVRAHSPFDEAPANVTVPVILEVRVALSMMEKLEAMGIDVVLFAYVTAS